MKRYIHCICFAFVIAFVGMFFAPTITQKEDGKNIINHYYADVSGFGISKSDEEAITQQGGASTYGEIKPESADRLIAYLKPNKDDVFVDAGSGVGKLVVHVFFSTDVKKCKGIELSQDRHAQALKVREALKKDGKIPAHRLLEFENANILTTPLDDTTIFFMCSTCFSDELMQQITEKLLRLKPGLRVVTLKQLPKNTRFVLQKTLQLPMTWSSASSVYIYELKQ